MTTARQLLLIVATLATFTDVFAQTEEPQAAVLIKKHTVIIAEDSASLRLLPPFRLKYIKTKALEKDSALLIWNGETLSTYNPQKEAFEKRDLNFIEAQDFFARLAWPGGDKAEFIVLDDDRLDGARLIQVLLNLNFARAGLGEQKLEYQIRGRGGAASVLAIFGNTRLEGWTDSFKLQFASARQFGKFTPVATSHFEEMSWESIVRKNRDDIVSQLPADLTNDDTADNYKQHMPYLQTKLASGEFIGSYTLVSKQNGRFGKLYATQVVSFFAYDTFNAELKLKTESRSPLVVLKELKQSLHSGRYQIYGGEIKLKRKSRSIEYAHHDRYDMFVTDLQQNPAAVVEIYALRDDLEVMFSDYWHAVFEAGKQIRIYQLNSLRRIAEPISTVLSASEQLENKYFLDKSKRTFAAYKPNACQLSFDDWLAKQASDITKVDLDRELAATQQAIRQLAQQSFQQRSKKITEILRR